MDPLKWAQKWDLQQGDITGHPSDLLAFRDFIERSDGSMDPEKAVRVFNIHRGFHQRIDFNEGS